jgi:BirA family biotin operon repressor/biotin-[acetyl-CoA-carboxylase] ligase
MGREPLDPVRLRGALGVRWVRVEVLGQTMSTNADLLARDGAPDHSLLVAEVQTAGRGRFERSWESPAGAGLTFSALLRLSAPLPQWGWLPLLAGAALQYAVEQVTGVAGSLKWPNDLLAPDGRKLAGILTQTSGTVAVIGIGLNVDTTVDELPVENATSLAMCGAGPVDRTELLVAIASALDMRFRAWEAAGGDPSASGVAAAYRAACSTLGARVRVTRSAQDSVQGDALDIDDTGRLVVHTGHAEIAISAGDVEHLRPA